MKRYIISIATFSLLLFSVGRMSAWAQTTPSTDNHTVQEEAEGKEVWENLQAKQLECKNLTDDNFETLGEYFMGQMLGSSHEAMNTMMESMTGKEGEKQMHVVMGKRLSGCDTSVQLPQNGVGFIPMMWMMGSAGSPQMGGGGNSMMGGWNGFGILGWLPMLLFWILLILGVVALFRYFGSSTRSSDKGKSPLDILKERYAKGEIDKKEFKQIKKDLS